MYSGGNLFGVCDDCFGGAPIGIRPWLVERDAYTERTWYGWRGVYQLLKTTSYGAEYQRMLIDLFHQLRRFP